MHADLFPLLEEDQIDKMREVACEENRVTVQLANYVAKSRGWDKSYSPWGKDRINLDDALKELPEEVIREVTGHGGG